MLPLARRRLLEFVRENVAPVAVAGNAVAYGKWRWSSVAPIGILMVKMFPPGRVAVSWKVVKLLTEVRIVYGSQLAPEPAIGTASLREYSMVWLSVEPLKVNVPKMFETLCVCSYVKVPVKGWLAILAGDVTVPLKATVTTVPAADAGPDAAITRPTRKANLPKHTLDMNIVVTSRAIASERMRCLQ